MPDEVVYEKGYWNGLETKIRKVWGIVPEHDPAIHPPQAWWKALVGREVPAVEVILDGVNQGGGTMYLYESEFGAAWEKVTTHRGSPQYSHYNIYLINVTPRKD